MPKDSASSSNPDTVKKVLPGQPGTKKLVEKYGQRLCVFAIATTANANGD